MSTGLRQFPDDVLDRLTLGQAMSLAKLWEKSPGLINSMGGVARSGDRTGSAEAGKRPDRYTTREETAALLRTCGARA